MRINQRTLFVAGLLGLTLQLESQAATYNAAKLAGGVQLAFESDPRCESFSRQDACLAIPGCTWRLEIDTWDRDNWRGYCVSLDPNVPWNPQPSLGQPGDDDAEAGQWL